MHNTYPASVQQIQKGYPHKPACMSGHAILTLQTYKIYESMQSMFDVKYKQTAYNLSRLYMQHAYTGALPSSTLSHPKSHDRVLQPRCPMIHIQIMQANSRPICYRIRKLCASEHEQNKDTQRQPQIGSWRKAATIPVFLHLACLLYSKKKCTFLRVLCSNTALLSPDTGENCRMAHATPFDTQAILAGFCFRTILDKSVSN